MGRRTADDARQIRRWRAIARHVAAIRKNCEQGDLDVPPAAAAGRAALGLRQPRSHDEPPRPAPIRIGISACLLGEAVRFDGGHKRDTFLTETFGRFVEWVPVCPEVECGLGTPRESMRLVRVGQRRAAAHRQDGRRSHRSDGEYTPSGASRELASEDLCGYVLKKDSPSCGLERVKVYGAHNVPAKIRAGIFAARLVERFPDLPVEEEGRLSDPRLRENFVERVFAYWRLRDLFSGTMEPGRARALSHRAQADPDGAFARGVSAARASGGARTGVPAQDLERRYTEAFMAALAVIATAAPARERAAAHGRILQGPARSRNRRPSCSPRSTTIAAGSCRSSCRSRCCGTTSGCTTCRTWPDSCIWSRIRRS